MTEIKSHEFDGFLRQSLGQRIFLIYGPDRGLVSERAFRIAEKSGVKLDDPFALIKLDTIDLQSDPDRLLNEANTIGLFGGQRLIWLRAGGAEKVLLDSVTRIAEDPSLDCFVIIEGGDLKKGTALRKLAESNRAIVAVACYGDDAKALNSLVDDELGQFGLRITPEARRLLNESLGGDRMASRNEIRKLALYCRGAEVITETQVEEIVGDASATSVDDAIDAVLKGDCNGLQQSMKKIVASKTSVFLVLQSCLKQFQLLDTMRAEMDGSRTTASQVTATMGRHLHFRRKPLIESALATWSVVSIRRELSRLQAAIYQSRQKASLEESIAMQTLLAITVQSARK